MSVEAEALAQWNKRTTGPKRGFLMPCPSCGGDPIERQPDGCRHWYTECSVCGFRTLARETVEDAVALWNRRNG